MYDKVKIWLPVSKDTMSITRYLESPKDILDRETGDIRTYGKIEGLKVCVYPTGCSITGSMAKFLYNNNVYSLDRHSTQKAITKLADSIHCNISNGKITELEFGTQFVMKKPVGAYLNKLGDMPILLRCPINGSTLYYQHKSKYKPKTLCFYDKGLEIKGKKIDAPKGLDNSNLLRYEMRLKGRLPQQLKVPVVEVDTLCDKAFYRLLIVKWRDLYCSIKKTKQVKTGNQCEIKTVSDAYNNLVGFLISQADSSIIKAFMEDLRMNKTFSDTKYYTRLANKINEITSHPIYTITDEDVRELDTEIKNVCSYV
ncbi:MAG TPA: hypothetical protein PLG47_03185 [Candidatus Dojkabacteria bacterium]|nr:hypothetical protein [Candidatus Dojkabacteria bacterium]